MRPWHVIAALYLLYEWALFVPDWVVVFASGAALGWALRTPLNQLHTLLKKDITWARKTSTTKARERA